MDDLDRRILSALKNNNRLSFAELAEVVGSSGASCMDASTSCVRTM
ncbi:AsnC family transcriptional regulator [Mesorhizobium sp. B4-1-4]|nr:AsnC family transcriptional regulator [Mesorhizobium sp. B4-1-4]UCI31833.1 AsnC family transcriptional regulator [Mesorhizobium sp. B4-1-4]